MMGSKSTQEFLRPGGRDAFGQTATGCFTEERFCATATRLRTSSTVIRWTPA